MYFKRFLQAIRPRPGPAQTVWNTTAVLKHKLSVTLLSVPHPVSQLLQEILGVDSCCSAAGWRSYAFCGRWSDV